MARKPQSLPPGGPVDPIDAAILAETLERKEALAQTVSPLMNKAEAAELLRVSVRSLESLLARRPCPIQSLKAGTRRVIVRASLQAHIAQCIADGLNLLTSEPVR